MRKISAKLILASLMCLAPVLAESAELDPVAAAGKSIYEAVTHRLGCERCHRPDGTAKAEGKTCAAERSIQGKSAQEVKIAIMATPMMWNVKLNDEELEQVAAYLNYLLDASN